MLSAGYLLVQFRNKSIKTNIIKYLFFFQYVHYDKFNNYIKAVLSQKLIPGSVGAASATFTFLKKSKFRKKKILWTNCH